MLAGLVEARDVVESFHDMLRHKSLADLEAWIDRAARSLVASFANGVIRDRLQSRMRELHDGRTVRQKVSSQSSSSSNGKCTAAGNLIWLRQASSERRDVIEIASEPRLDAETQSKQG